MLLLHRVGILGEKEGDVKDKSFTCNKGWIIVTTLGIIFILSAPPLLRKLGQVFCNTNPYQNLMSLENFANFKQKVIHKAYYLSKLAFCHTRC